MGQENRTVFYGWWIVGYVVANAIILSGTAFLAIGVFVRPLEEEFRWSRGEITSAFGISLLVAGFIGPFAGKFIDRYGARLSLLFGLVGMVVAFLMLAAVQTLWQLYAIFFFMACVRPFSSYLPGSVLLARWFRQRRATVLGLVAAGYSIGGLLLPLTALVIDLGGFRAGFIFDAILIALLIPAMMIIVRERPEDRGLVPDGRVEIEAGMPHSAPTLHIEHESTLREALHSPAFWSLTFAFTFLFTSQTAFLIHGVPFFESAGNSTATATIIMLVLTLTTGTLRAGLGFIVDRVASPYRLAGVLSCSMALGLFVLTLSSHTVGIAIFLPFFAVGMAGGPVFEPVLYLRGFGAKHFGEILGVAGVMETFGSWLGPTFAGFMYDSLGDYEATFIIFALIFVAAASLFLAAGRSAARRTHDRSLQPAPG